MNPLKFYNSLVQVLRPISDFPEAESNEIIYNLFGVEKGKFFLLKDIPESKIIIAKHMLNERSRGIPLSYILGKTDFMGFELLVSRHVFIPRPDTEVLVETALKYSKQQGKFCDVGTGSGAIAVAFSLLSGMEGFATDTQPAAVKLANKNGLRHRAPFVAFLCDTLSCFKDNSLDTVLSNPPYVAESEFDKLPIVVKKEPKTALLSGENGLFHTKKLIKQAYYVLKRGGYLIIEMSHRDSGKYVEMGSNFFKIVEISKDLNHIDRVIVMKKS